MEYSKGIILRLPLFSHCQKWCANLFDDFIQSIAAIYAGLVVSLVQHYIDYSFIMKYYTVMFIVVILLYIVIVIVIFIVIVIVI